MVYFILKLPKCSRKSALAVEPVVLDEPTCFFDSGFFVNPALCSSLSLQECDLCSAGTLGRLCRSNHCYPPNWIRRFYYRSPACTAGLSRTFLQSMGIFRKTSNPAHKMFLTSALSTFNSSLQLHPASASTLWSSWQDSTSHRACTHYHRTHPTQQRGK